MDTTQLLQIFDWLTQNWASVGGILALLFGLPAIWFAWENHRRENRKARHETEEAERKKQEHNAKIQSLITQADKLIFQADQIRDEMLQPEIDPSENKPENEIKILLAGKVQVSEANNKIWDAIDMYKQAIEFASTNNKLQSKLWVKIGDGYYKLKSWEEAGKAYRNVLKLNKQHPIAWKKLAETQRNNSKDNDAIYSIKQHLNIKPSDTESQKSLDSWQKEKYEKERKQKILASQSEEEEVALSDFEYDSKNEKYRVA